MDVFRAFEHLAAARPKIREHFAAWFRSAGELVPATATPPIEGIEGFDLEDHLGEGYFLASFAGQAVRFRLTFGLAGENDTAMGVVICERHDPKEPSEWAEIGRVSFGRIGLIEAVEGIHLPQAGTSDKPFVFDGVVGPAIVADFLKLTLRRPF